MTISNLERFRLPYTRGNPNGKYCFVGEAPGHDEWLAFKKGLRDTAFIGESGNLLDKMIGLANIPMEDCYFTNVYKNRPPGNEIKEIRRADIESGIKLLRNELAALPNCSIIIPTGNLALQAVTDIQTIRWKPKQPDRIKELAGIGNWRGSILSSVPLNGRPQGTKTIPTFHSAFVMRQYKFKETVIGDLERIKEDAEFKALRHPVHNVITSPTKKQTLEFLKEAKHARRICTDIENKGMGIFCLGIAINKRDAICIPFEMPDGSSYWNIHEEAEIWLAVEDLFKYHKGHVGQFYFHDAYYYHHYGLIEALRVRFTGLAHDTFGAHVCLYGELPHTLAYLCSVYTRQPYYKDEGRSWKRGDDILDFWLYNAKDVCLTMEISEVLEQELEEWGKTAFYKRYYMDLFPHLLQTSIRGIAIDEGARSAAKKDYGKQWVDLQNRLQKSVGRAEVEGKDPELWKKDPNYINVEAHVKLRIFLSDHFDTNVKSTGEKILRKLRGQISPVNADIINTILDIKGIRKTKESFLDPKLGHGPRFNFILKYSTETGRLAGQKDPFGNGANPQTVPDGICRSWIIADLGMYLLYVDLSQAEARMVAWLSQCKTLMDMFDAASSPAGLLPCLCGSGRIAKKCCKDVHRLSAALIFSKPVQSITGDERQLGKKIRHARNYMMGPYTFSATTGLTVRECKRLLRLDESTYPEIPLWWNQISLQLSKTRTLKNPFGRERIFFGRPYDDATLREAIAFIPQSTVPDIVNLAYMKVQNAGLQVLMQGHDALLVQAYERDVERACLFVKKALEIPFLVHGVQRIIPAEPAIGKCWDGDQMCTLEEWRERQAA